jgi:hypothetical protein
VLSTRWTESGEGRTSGLYRGSRGRRYEEQEYKGDGEDGVDQVKERTIASWHLDDLLVTVGVDDPGDGTDRESLAGPGSERRAQKMYHLACHRIKRTPLPSAPTVD